MCVAFFPRFRGLLFHAWGQHFHFSSHQNFLFACVALIFSAHFLFHSFFLLLIGTAVHRGVGKGAVSLPKG